MTNKIKDIYILRRTKDDLAKINERLRLPNCYFENVELDMFPDERQLYEFVFHDAQATIQEAFRNAVSLNSKNMVILECLLRARQCMILPQMYLMVSRKSLEHKQKNGLGGPIKWKPLPYD